MYDSKTMLLSKISSVMLIGITLFSMSFKNVSVIWAAACSFKKCAHDSDRNLLFNMINTIITEHPNFMRRNISVNVRNII